MKLEKKILGLINLYLQVSIDNFIFLLEPKIILNKEKKLSTLKKFINLVVFSQNHRMGKTYKIIDRYENIIFIFSSLAMKHQKRKKVVIFPTKTENHLNQYVILNALERKKD